MIIFIAGWRAVWVVTWVVGLIAIAAGGEFHL